MHGYKSKVLNPTGKRSICFKLSNALRPYQPIAVPCGRCIGCRLERSRQWAIRCLHEKQLHEDNSFITLTYSEVPPGGTLIKRDFQLFMKRLRKHFAPKRVSYFHCGEYGETTRRPHYHAILFGVRFVDQKPFSRAADGSTLYTSETLARLWPSGHSTVGEVTFESAAYVARYIMKKITGPAQDEKVRKTPNALLLKPYERLDESGEIHTLLPEYTTMSLKPAIAKDWYGLYQTDVYPSDEVVVRGKVMKPPKYYDAILEKTDLELHTAIKEQRKQEAHKHSAHSTTRRLLEREEIKHAQTRNLNRNLE